ncbi:MAG: prepilin peptidase [Pirellulales bacterium]|nr:prepilin peptidase [Pirellulales bacterium]
MHFIVLPIPMTLRLALLFGVGAILGAAVNALVYGQRFAARPIGPWLAPSPQVPTRRWFDRLPIFGWLALRREEFLHGPTFWIRPLMVELLLGIGCAALYRYEISGGLLPASFPRPFPPDILLALHLQFAAHVILIFWMTAASLIDADETVIPDAITVTGTLCGLLLAGLFPQSLLPDVFPLPNNLLAVFFIHLASPNAWPPILNPPHAVPLAMGLGCFLAACVALLPRTWYRRHGVRRAVQLCLARIGRERYSRWIAALAGLGGLAIFGCWRVGSDAWQGLLSALIGMAAGGAVVWAVRIVCGAVLRREAMGFGDVTLLAMIGSFLGWQAAVVIFFLSPFAALVVGLFRLLFFRQREIPFGPFLCLATLYTILAWDAVWNYVQGVFGLGWIVPLVLLCCFPLMALLLLPFRWLFHRK